MIEQLYQSGNVAFVILAVMALEAVFLAKYIKRFPSILTGLGSGACLILALRAALLQQGWMAIALFLVMAAILHLLEIWQWLRLARSN